MSKPIIQVQGLGKKYVIRHQQQAGARYHSLRDTLADSARSLGRMFRRPATTPTQSTREDFWALRNVSFDVQQGEVVGIIGRNGAGKSTLLKILSRITEPTEGEVRLRGRVASLLEVGTGFHPELTGRENIYLNGTILGMTQAEIRRKFDEIVAFAEVEKFLDTPVKRYSSGMYMRLAFAIAAHLDPEILVVDEVLAVGDALFQKKCLQKMGEVAHGGRTILFVSHNMSAIQQLCGTAVFLQKGRNICQGKTSDVVRRYLGEHGDGHIFVRAPQVNGQPTLTSGRIIHPPSDSDVIQLQLGITVASFTQLSLNIRLTDSIGTPVGFGTLGTFQAADRVSLERGESIVTVELTTESLAVGNYLLSFDLVEPEVVFFDRLNDCLEFELTRAPKSGRDRVFRQSWGHGSIELTVKRIQTGNN